jgi:hypothetical protein
MKFYFDMMIFSTSQTIYSDNIRELPIRRIAFTTPPDERARLVGVGISEATEWIERTEKTSVSSASFSAFSDSKLGRWLDECLSPVHIPDPALVHQHNADPLNGSWQLPEGGPVEQSDVVHDLLAHLAGQMIEMNKQKRAAVEAFWLDLEGVTNAATFKILRNKGKQENSLWKAEACRPFVDEKSHATRTLEESLGWSEEAFKAFVKVLAGRVTRLSDLVGIYREHSPTYRNLVARIERTDWLIDQIVYQLYGLTEEEIAIVEA